MALRHFKMFLSSPGDVADERRVALEVLKALPGRPLLRGLVTIEPVSWNDPQASVPMDARLTPQQAVDRGLARPSECDLTIVMLWGRMGTPIDQPRKPDGSPYVSGTEYEFEDAKTGGKSVYVYRRLPQPIVDVEDLEGPEKLRQRKLVNKFFEQFKNTDGSLKAGINPYGDVAEFKGLLDQHVEHWLRDQLRARPAQRASRATAVKGAPTVPASYIKWLKGRCESVELLGLRLKKGQAVTHRCSTAWVRSPSTSPVTPERGSPRSVDG